MIRTIEISCMLGSSVPINITMFEDGQPVVMFHNMVLGEFRGLCNTIEVRVEYSREYFADVCTAMGLEECDIGKSVVQTFKKMDEQ